MLRISVTQCCVTHLMKSLGGGAMGYTTTDLSQVIHNISISSRKTSWTASFCHMTTTLLTFCFHTFLSHPCNCIPVPDLIFWSLFSIQLILENQCIKSSFPFLQSMLIRLSHILPPNIRQSMKNWPNLWPQFSSLLLTFSPATNYLRYVRRASVTLQYLNWFKKIHTSQLDQFTLYGFRNNHQLLKSGNRVSS